MGESWSVKIPLFSFLGRIEMQPQLSALVGMPYKAKLTEPLRVLLVSPGLSETVASRVTNLPKLHPALLVSAPILHPPIIVQGNYFRAGVFGEYHVWMVGILSLLLAR